MASTQEKKMIFHSIVQPIHAPSAANNFISPIPIPSRLQNKQKIKEINDLALKANELRSEAYYLEQDAIKQMNEEVIFAMK